MKYKECVVFNIDRIDVFVLQQKKIMYIYIDHHHTYSKAAAGVYTQIQSTRCYTLVVHFFNKKLEEDFLIFFF